MKMKGELRRLNNGKQFGINSLDMMFKTDTYMQRKSVDAPANARELLVPLTSDKGLCGGINSGIVRDVRDYVAQRDRSRCDLFTIGDKAAAAMARNFRDILKTGISGISTPYNYPTVMAISEHVIQASAQCDKITVFYNEYKSAIATIIRHMELMPRQRFLDTCLLYTSPSPRDRQKSRMPSSA